MADDADDEPTDEDAAEGADEDGDEEGEGSAMSLSLLKFVGQASLVDDAMLPS